MSPTDFSFKTSAERFTPNDLIELARPGVGLANSAGDLALISVSKYSFDEKTNKKSIHLVPIDSTKQPIEVSLVTVGEAFWLDTRTIAHAVVEGEGDDKATALYVLSVEHDADAPAGSSTPKISGSPTLIGKFPTESATNFKYSADAGVLVFSDYVHADGDLTAVKANDKAWADRGNSAYVYDETFERHWDKWTGPKQSALFTVKLAKAVDDKWHLGNTFVSLFRGTGHACPVEPFGGAEDFDISAQSVIYTTKDPQLPKAMHTKQNVYITALDGSTKPRELTHGRFGATHCPVFSTQGDKAAWLQLDNDGDEADRAKIVIYDLRTDVQFTLTQHWDRSPVSLKFSKHDQILYLTAGEHARVKIFALSVPPTPASSTADPLLAAEYRTPLALTSSGSVAGIQPLSNGTLLFTRSSLTTPNELCLLRGLQALDEREPWRGDVEQLTTFSADALAGKHMGAGEAFWFEGAEGVQVHGWLVKPPGFKKGEKKRWPVALLVHGGPQSAWHDQWSTIWNPNVFASQGYMTVLINPTGSTTFGQAFTDAVAEDWGGKPFVDLQKGWAHILNEYPEIDTDRAVAAGASWGGYAMHWIQGHPEYNFGFKALVCHDGKFSALYGGYCTDELFFFNKDWGGRPWDPKTKEVLAKFDPQNFVEKWSTPELILHGSKDYRIPVTDGISTFHALLQLGVPARLVIFPDENHFVLNQQNSLKWHYEVFRWFDKYVGDTK